MEGMDKVLADYFSNEANLDNKQYYQTIIDFLNKTMQ
jgi:hypothetical protein